MRGRGKTEHVSYNNGEEYFYTDQNMPSFPCTKHPYSASSSSTSGGICAQCLTDRLYQLVCPVCGEQKQPSCSCSSNDTNGASSTRNSFYLDNDKDNAAEISCPRPSRTDNDIQQYYQQRVFQQHEDFAVAPPLRRSNSTCIVDINRGRDQGRSSGGGGGGGAFSRIGKLFRKRKDKKSFNHNNNSSIDEVNDETINNNEMMMPQCGGFTRSRSMCSYRGGYDNEGSGGFPMSSSYAARASNVNVNNNNYMLDSAKMSCFSESEARMSNFDYENHAGFGGQYRNMYSVKESDFSSCGDDPAFIDLNLHGMNSDTKPDLPAMPPSLRRGGFGMSSTREFGGYNGRGGEFMSNNNYGGRYSNVSEQELRKCKKNNKVWKWFFRHQSSSSRRKDEDHHHGFNS